MITQAAIRRDSVLRKSVIGAHPIISVFIEHLKIREILRSYIKQDGRARLSLEDTLSVLIHNILSTPLPMYEIADWLAPLDAGTLGLDSTQGAHIQDDRIGQALESLYAGRHKDVFFRLALRAIKVFDLDCSRVHQDTTSITFSGRYQGWMAPEILTHGHNKDHRPDLKQLVLGLSVTADGAFPLIHKVYDGNQTDDRLHPENHQRLRRLLQRSDFIYVADCKLATESNLMKIASCGGRFVTVMPRTWKEDAGFRDRVRKGMVQWDPLLSRRNNRNPDSRIDRYHLARGTYAARGYAVLWIYSEQKSQQDAETRQRHIEKALEDLRELQTRLNRYQLKTRNAIDQAIRKILTAQGCKKWIDYTIHTHRQYQMRYSKPGRPRLGQRRRRSWTPYFAISFAINEDSLAQEMKTDGVFPLITNIAAEYNPKRILEIYKYQPFLEKRHSQLKTWQAVTPVLLKKSERVVAYLHMHVMALMVATLIERKLRLGMRKNGIPYLPIYPESRPCPYPTLFDIVRLFQGVERYEVEQHGQVTVFPAQLTPLQKQVLALLEVPETFYH